MPQVGMHEAKSNLSKLVERAHNGEEIVITRNGLPVARLEPLSQVGGLAAVYGALAGRIVIAEDFDDLPADFQAAFGLE